MSYEVLPTGRRFPSSSLQMPTVGWDMDRCQEFLRGET
jgi:hypothetical protein